jgi:hypothetical protein
MTSGVKAFTLGATKFDHPVDHDVVSLRFIT